MSEMLKDIKNEIFDNEKESKALDDRGSVVHSRTQGRLTVLIGCDERFEVMPELSLDVSQIDLSQFALIFLFWDFPLCTGGWWGRVSPKFVIISLIPYQLTQQSPVVYRLFSLKPLMSKASCLPR
ncbi:hypothetical protein [Candidatus Parabeggiatoa sp. HSG14]|uniref:hypothetical protein n=1 Tax=Candidatus Parabeggiatoa sp. HSG14 TaxID=3055593 RepID=UPI0025A70CA9|nr:hypothetical protein [Thiotrichales bacterium HSG14]